VFSIHDERKKITEELVNGSTHSKDTKFVVAPKDKLTDFIVKKLVVLLDPEMEPLVDLGCLPPFRD